MLHLFPLAMFLAYLTHIVVVQVGAPILGEERPDWKRTAITVLLASLLVLLVSLTVGLPIGCLSSIFGTGFAIGASLLAAIMARGALYSYLLGLSLGRASILALIGAVLSWLWAGGAYAVFAGWTAPFGL